MCMAYFIFSNRKAPPCPDPDSYILVRGKKGMFWRRKRGTVKKAELNETLQRNAGMLKICAAISRRTRARLSYYLTRLEPGRLHNRICTLMQRQLKEIGRAGLQCLQGLEFQERFAMELLLTGYYNVAVKDGMLEVRIPIEEYTVNRNSGIVTGYFFQLIMVYGDCMEEYGLKVEEETSEAYGIGQRAGECRMMMVLPEKEWAVILKVSCIEGNELAKAPRNYGMKVVGVGVGSCQ
jgi:hypothetical protein